MKKLFATLLAATMVAGTAVSAFALTAASGQTAASDDDYTLSAQAYLKRNGIYSPINNTSSVEGGDKIYYPILAKESAVKDNSSDDTYRLLNYASEVDKLKATIKGLHGSKYIKGVSIVRENVIGNAVDTTVGTTRLTTPGTAETKGVLTLDFSGFTAASDASTLSIGDVDVTIGNNETGTALYNKIKADMTVGKAVTIDSVDYKVKSVIGTDGKMVLETAAAGVTTLSKTNIAAAVTDNGTSAVALTTAKVTVVDGVANANAIYTVTNLPPSLADKEKITLTFNGVSASYTNTTGTAEVASAYAPSLASAYNTAVTRTGAAKKYTAAASGSDITLTYNEYVATNASMKATVTNGASDASKIYCVEVVLADYFGTDESELEYDLTLRTNRNQYATKDDSDNTKPATYFNLGEDAKEIIYNAQKLFVNGSDFTSVKFRKGELTLGINKYTGAINLDEAKETQSGEATDIEKIFLEGDNFDFEVKASGEGKEYLELNADANKKVVVSNQDAKMNFFNFPGKPEFDFTGTAKFTVEDPDVNYYFYEIVDDKPVKTSAKYNKDDECFELRTRTLGSYVISDKELEAAEDPSKDTDKPADKPATETPVNPTTPGKNVPTGALA